MKNPIAVFALITALPAVAAAQKPITETASTELSATIVAIDRSTRAITLKDKSGATQTIEAGPGVKRFDELKVGDTITFRYYESVAYNIRKPGQPGNAPQGTGAETVVHGSGPRPGGTVSRQETATVVVKEIDRQVPYVTVLRDDGHTVTFKVEDKKYLEGLQVGDRVEVTYTVALMISVK
jgi:Cu/Ag efflux protein CusF